MEEVLGDAHDLLTGNRDGVRLQINGTLALILGYVSNHVDDQVNSG